MFVKRKFHSALAQALSDQGVDTIFGVSGEGNLFMLESFVKDLGGKYIRAAHEAGAVLMANGYASTTGKLGVATVTHGPALTNSVTALVEAVRSRTPLLLVAGDTPVARRFHQQDIDQREVVLITGAAFEQVRSVASVVMDTTIAIRRAIAESRPVVLNVPADYQSEDVEYEQFPLSLVTHQAVSPDAKALDGALGIIASARRPLVLAGLGAVQSNARTSILRLAERIGAPVATTIRAKDYFAGEPFNLGVFGTMSLPPAVEAMAECDCVVAFGASLNKWTTASGSLLAGKAVVQCDVDRARLGAYGPISAGVVGDAAAVADMMVGLLDLAEVRPGGFRSEQLAQALGAYDPARSYKDCSTENTVDIRSVMVRLEASVPADRTLVSDGGQFLWDAWKILHVQDPRAFVLSVNFGAIGMGMGAAIGAGFGRPGKPVLLVTGDGGFTLGGLAEFNTAVRNQVDLIAVVFNNGTYGSEYIHLKESGADPALSLFDWPDFAPVADALGGRGLTVRNLGDLDRMTAAIAQRDRPLLIDVKLDPERIAMDLERG